jgi:multidrug efflux pump
MLGVTLVGVLLTPVFFYVIQGASESKLFAGAAMQWVISISLGGLMGAAVGFSLSQIGVGSPLWAPIAGGCAGVPIALLVREVHRRMAGKARPEKGDQPP